MHGNRYLFSCCLCPWSVAIDPSWRLFRYKWHIVQRPRAMQGAGGTQFYVIPGRCTVYCRCSFDALLVENRLPWKGEGSGSWIYIYLMQLAQNWCTAGWLLQRATTNLLHWLLAWTYFTPSWLVQLCKLHCIVYGHGSIPRKICKYHPIMNSRQHLFDRTVELFSRVKAWAERCVIRTVQVQYSL